LLIACPFFFPFQSQALNFQSLALKEGGEGALMFESDEGPKDWEVKDEEPPEALKKKWERDEEPARGTVVCPVCKKETPAGGLTCIFCSAMLSQGGCPIGCFLSWVKRLFRRG
jgi:hypothetical protein